MYNCIDNPLSISPPSSSPQHHNLTNDQHTNIQLPTLTPTRHHNRQQNSGSSPSTPTTTTRSHNHSENGSSSSSNGGYNNHSDHHMKKKLKKLQGFEISSNNNNDEEHNGDNKDDYSSVLTQQQQQQQGSSGPSNENLLGTAFCTFMGFALIQTVVAVFAGSEAMLGDSAAMIVDALTYLFNWYAERKKATYESIAWQRNTALMATTNIHADDSTTRQRIVERIKRKNILQLELLPPLMSVSVLVVVTFFVLNQSIRVLILDVHREIDQQGNPNIQIMMYFSIANLGLDLINVANFAKAKHLFGYETSEETHTQGHEALATTGDDSDHFNDDDEEQNHGKTTSPSPRRAPSHDNDSEDSEEGDQDHTANLNMCSAYTHVFADTLRSIAVLVAACLSVLIEGITPEEADASAAVVVSGLILISLIPLFKGLRESHNELRLIKAEEKNDELIFA